MVERQRDGRKKEARKSEAKVNLKSNHESESGLVVSWVGYVQGG